MVAGMNDYPTAPLSVAALTLALERWLDQPGRDAGSAVALPTAEPADDTGAGELPLMDFERLAQFREFDDDDLSMTRAVIDLFRTDAAQRLEAIARAIRTDDAQALSWACHALVGAAGNVGALAVHAVATRLETQAALGSVPLNATQALEKLQIDWDKTRTVLDACL